MVAWRASGLTAAQFCDGGEYAARTLLRWSSELRLTRPTTTLARIEPVTKAPEIARVIRARAVEVPGAAIVVVLGDARVEVGRGASREVLSMVLDALSERSSE